VDVIELPGERQEELRAFLAKDPVQNVFALGVLEEHGIAATASEGLAVYGLEDGGKLMGALLVGGGGGLAIPCVFDPGAATELGNHLRGRVRLRSAFGERYAVDALVRALGCGPARWSRPQRLFAASADDLGPFVSAELRPAITADLPQLIALSAAAIKESLGEDPLAYNRASFERRVEARVALSRTFVLSDARGIYFKVDVGVRCKQGAEIEGAYTAPEMRRRGIATLALGQLSRTLLSSIPRVVMRVDEKEAGLAAVCRKVGFTAMRPQRLVVLG
jgi:hypothetical protein